MYNATPLNTDPYSRYMVEQFDEKDVISVPTVFQTFFSRPGIGQKLYSPDANLVDIDILRGNERIAAMIPRNTISRPLGSTQKNTNVEKFSTFSRSFPLIEEEGDIGAGQLNFRTAGENPFSKKSRLERMRSMLLSNHKEHVRRIVRLNEVLSAESVLEGEMPAILDTSNTDLIYDFRRKSTHVVTLTTPWTDSSDPAISDIDTACGLIRQDGHVSPDMMFLGGDAMEAFLDSTKVQTYADNRRFQLITIDSQVPSQYQPFIDAGAQPRGYLMTPKGFKLFLFTYVDGYTNSAGTFTKYLPDDYVLFAFSGARCDRLIGPPEKLPSIPMRDQFYSEMLGFNPNMPPVPANIKNAGQILDPGMFYCDCYPANDWKTITVRTQSAPIFVPVQTDAYVTYKSVA